MSRKIYKYEIPAPEAFHDDDEEDGISKVKMPAGAKILTVGTQVTTSDSDPYCERRTLGEMLLRSTEEKVYVWAEVDREASPVTYYFKVVPTGEEAPDSGAYVGTVHFRSAALVFHVYQIQ